MTRATRILAIVAASCLAVTIRAQDEAALLKGGESVVENLPTLSSGTVETSYFEILRGPDEAVGYITVSIEAVRKWFKTTYRYTSETIISFPGGAKRTAKVKATLTSRFEPIEVETERGQIETDGTRGSSTERAEVGDKMVVLTVDIRGRIEKKEVARPASPFIYGIEMLIQRIDFDKHKLFALREFDVARGTTGPLVFSHEIADDGTPTVITTRSDGSPAYQFWFDGDGKLERWGLANLPVLFVSTTKQRVEQIKAQW